MKKHLRLTILALAAALLTGTVLYLINKRDRSTPTPAETAKSAEQISPGAASPSSTPPAATTPSPSPSPSPSAQNTVSRPVTSDGPKAATPHSRRDDLLRDARELASHTADGTRPGTTVRTSLWKTTFKYPLLRIVETWADDELLSWLAMVADHVLVRTREDLSAAQARELSASVGMNLRKDMYTKNTYLLEVPEANLDALPRAIALLSTRDEVLIAEPDYVFYTTATTPNDSSFVELWGLNNTGQDGGTADVDIDAPEAWDLITGNPNVVVGVIDTGVQYDHPDLAANMWMNTGEIADDGIDNDANGFIDDIYGWDFVNNDSDPMDGNNHGTHCSGTIGGVGDNFIGVAGVNWSVKLMALKFLSDDGFGSSSDAIDAVTYGTANGADLTSNSWGGGGFSDALMLAIYDAYSNGIPFVAAAGNSSTDNDQSPHYPSNYEVPNVISVAAYDRNGAIAGFSSFGETTVDIGAPGVDIYSTVAGSDYDSFSGTSMATPHVAGVVAQMLGILPTLSPEDILQFLIDTSDYMAALDGKTVANGGVNLLNAVSVVSGAYVLLQDSAIQDDGSGMTLGNGDGIINPEETIGLWITPRNYGTEAATSVVATLVSADAAITVSNSVIAIGTLAPQTSMAATSAFICGVADVATPYTADMALSFSDAAGNTWTSKFSLTVYTSTTASGMVGSVSGPMPDATVRYAGPVRGSVTTAPDGTYSFVLTDGTFDLSASKAGYLTDGPYSVNATGTTIHQDFYLTQPEIDVTLDPISITLYQCETSSIPIVITNLGDGTLTYSLAGLSDQWTPETGTLWHVSTRRAYEGDDSWYYGDEDSGTFDNGEANDGTLTSDLLMLPYSVTGFSFYSWKETENSSFWDLSLVDISTNNGTTWTTLAQTDDTSLSWNLESVPLDSYPGLPARLRFRFDTIDSILNFYEGWYVDQFRLDGMPMGWLAFNTPDGTVASGATETVYLNIRGDLLEPGTVTNGIGIISNDGDEPVITAPVTVTVLASPRYQIAAKLVSNDDDGDGFPEPGENLDLRLVIENTGSLDSTNGLSLTLNSANTNVVIGVDTASAPAVTTGGKTTNSAPFSLFLTGEVPGDTTTSIDFTLIVDDGDTCLAALPVQLAVRDYAMLCGTVIDECSLLAITGAAVTATSTSGITYASTVADGTGGFCLAGIPALSTELNVSAPGYAASNATVALSYTSNVWTEVTLRNDDLIAAPMALDTSLMLGSTGLVSLVLSNGGSCNVAYCLEDFAGGDEVAFVSPYTFRSSLAANGPAYAWTNIAPTGTLIPLDDGDTELLQIGFEFPFFGQTFTSLYLSGNGWISLTDDDIAFYPYELPNSFSPANMIAFYWADLDPGDGGTVHVENTDADTLVIQFTDVPFWLSPETITVQVALKSDGTILISTETIEAHTEDVGIGVQNGDRTKGIGFVSTADYPDDNTTIEIVPGRAFARIDADQLCGSVAAGATAEIEARFDAAGLTADSYQDAFTLELNGGTRTLTVPVSLSITGRIGHLVVTEPDAVSLSCTDAVPAICGTTVPRTWGLWAENGTTEAVRPVRGTSFGLNFDNGLINNGKIVGFNLRDEYGLELLTFYFVGGDSFYKVSSLGGDLETTIPWTDAGLRIWIETDGADYHLTAYRYEDASTHTQSGSFPFFRTAEDIRDLRFFNYEAGPGSNYDVFFNTLLVDGRMDNASQASYNDGWQINDGMEGGLERWTELDNDGTSGGWFIGENKSSGADSTACSAYGWSTSGVPLAVSYVEDDMTGSCGPITRTWSIAEGGVTVSAQRVFTVADNDAPVISCPPGVTVFNMGDAAVDTNDVTAVDACSDATVEHVSDSDNGGSAQALDPLIITRVYRAYDACGNIAMCTQTINVVTNPVYKLTAGNVEAVPGGFQLKWTSLENNLQYLDAQEHEPVDGDYPWITVYTVAPPAPATTIYMETNDYPGRNYRLRISP